MPDSPEDALLTVGQPGVDHPAHIDPNQQEIAKELGITTGEVRPVNPGEQESWAEKLEDLSNGLQGRPRTGPNSTGIEIEKERMAKMHPDQEVTLEEEK